MVCLGKGGIAEGLYRGGHSNLHDMDGSMVDEGVPDIALHKGHA